MMIGISGCGASGNHQDTSSSITESRVKASRTPEAVAVEGHFEPFFTFLEAEQKDFSRVKSYLSGITVVDTTKEEHNDRFAKTYDLILRKTEKEHIFEGTYSEREGEAKTVYPVSYNSSNNEVTFPDTTPEAFQKDLLIPVITDIHNVRTSEIKHHLLKHPQTELQALSYNMESSLTIYDELQTQFALPEPTEKYINLSKFGTTEYSGDFVYGLPAERYYISYLLVFEQ